MAARFLCRIGACLVVPVMLVLLAGCSTRSLMWIPDYHEVEKGETLFSISRYYHVRMSDLRYWNGMGRS
ncbi:MAG: LysM peptidoglycan-binding domain-containing protein, partial [Gammaproteobacteria bacterium]